MHIFLKIYEIPEAKTFGAPPVREFGTEFSTDSTKKAVTINRHFQQCPKYKIKAFHPKSHCVLTLLM